MTEAVEKFDIDIFHLQFENNSQKKGDTVVNSAEKITIRRLTEMTFISVQISSDGLVNICHEIVENCSSRTGTC